MENKRHDFRRENNIGETEASPESILISGGYVSQTVGMDPGVNFGAGGGVSATILDERANAMNQTTVPADDVPGTEILGGVEENATPTVGWLVCINGTNKGRDYALHTGSNVVGRGAALDVSLDEPAASHQGNIVVIFDSVNVDFYVQSVGGKNLSYLNNKPIFSAVILRPYDVIKLGKTELVFVPLCVPQRFDWEKGLSPVAE